MKGSGKLWRARNLVWLVPLLMIGWAWRGIPAGDIRKILGGLEAGQVLILGLLNLGILFLFSFRWWSLLRIQDYSVHYLALAGYRLSGFGVSFFTPGPQFGGEPLQAVLLHRRHNLPGAAAVASVTLDKLLELLANFTFLAIGIFIILSGGSGIDHLSTRLLPAVSLLLLLPLGYLSALWWNRRPFSRLADWFALRRKPSPRLTGIFQAIHSVEEQLAGLCQTKTRGVILIWLFSLSVWALVVMEYWLSFRFLGLRLDLHQVMVCLVAARLSLLTPLPGGLGALEASQVFAVQALGFDPAYGAGMILLVRLRDFLLAGLGLWLGAYLVKNLPAQSAPIPASGIIPVYESVPTSWVSKIE